MHLVPPSPNASWAARRPDPTFPWRCDLPHMRSDCRNSQALRRHTRARVFVGLTRACVFGVFIVAAASMPDGAWAQPGHEAPAAQETHAVEAETPHEESLFRSAARVANFAILAGVLVYFLRAPIAAYLASRGTQIREALVTAAETREIATAQLAEIARKLQTLPAELEALKAQGAQDVIAEQARIAQAAALERERLIEQTRREIATRLRLARRELTAHAAELAIAVAEARIKRSITPDDQLRLVDRFTSQLGHGAHGIHGTEDAR
jgi:F-type H+-transporting ATPase subunit b